MFSFLCAAVQKSRMATEHPLPWLDVLLAGDPREPLGAVLIRMTHAANAFLTDPAATGADDAAASALLLSKAGASGVRLTRGIVADAATPATGGAAQVTPWLVAAGLLEPKQAMSEKDQLAFIADYYKQHPADGKKAREKAKPRSIDDEHEKSEEESEESDDGGQGSAAMGDAPSAPPPTTGDFDAANAPLLPRVPPNYAPTLESAVADRFFLDIREGKLHRCWSFVPKDGIHTYLCPFCKAPLGPVKGGYPAEGKLKKHFYWSVLTDRGVCPKLQMRQLLFEQNEETFRMNVSQLLQMNRHEYQQPDGAPAAPVTPSKILQPKVQVRFVSVSPVCPRHLG